MAKTKKKLSESSQALLNKVNEAKSTANTKSSNGGQNSNTGGAFKETGANKLRPDKKRG